MCNSSRWGCVHKACERAAVAGDQLEDFHFKALPAATQQGNILYTLQPSEEVMAFAWRTTVSNSTRQGAEMGNIVVRFLGGCSCVDDSVAIRVFVLRKYKYGSR